MGVTIRKMTAADKDAVLEMMRVFYASPAVLTGGSEEIFRNDVETCLREGPYLAGYVMEEGGTLLGYAMAAKSYSTEFGKPCVWIEDLYVKPGFRGAGIGSQMLRFIQEQHPGCIFRLEVEEENAQALAAYKKNGFSVLPYLEMKK